MRKTAKSYLLLPLSLCLLLLATSCKDKHGELPIEDKPAATGLAYTQKSNRSLDTVYSNIVAALQANDAIGIVAQVDHQQNASNAGLSLNPTRVVLFGNPKLGTPLMQANQQAGLDLPQKMLVYKNDIGDVYTAFNSAQYLAERHGVGTVSTLPQIEMALTKLAESATGKKVQMADDNAVALNEGILHKVSANAFPDAYAKLRTAIEANANLKIVAELDHQQNAQSVGMTLRPTKLIVFGNPNLGTPLMQAEQTIGIDLPQKMLVYEDENGAVHIAYNDPYYLAERHNISGEEETLAKIATALNALASTAAE
ncbi:DUF302 domain-containing protein [Pontibacter sp. E15-1]|uniref:DUF302 domain-containing protein n=1 Tax=Pontibacter sp. E15-1 TaxID=2919918 RepID=UPI001F4FB602|nr:DUF302 domain-containing protein [Pontibacter sp. E15-1]MCJ8165603.1 DUF302 domain-containing protein [Pontibacter sp. E15-1]